jgi:hypothetical protein
MRKILLILTLFAAASVYAQSANDKVTGVVIKSAPTADEGIRVVHTDQESHKLQPAYYINGIQVSQTVVSTLDPTVIESINVIKGNLKVNKTDYAGQVNIKTKNAYHPNLISLNALKKKYTNLSNTSAVFMIDGTIINGDYDDYVVDEDYVLSIVIDKIENTKENLHIDLIKIQTKSDVNLKKAKEIKIRGNASPVT